MYKCNRTQQECGKNVCGRGKCEQSEDNSFEKSDLIKFISGLPSFAKIRMRFNSEEDVEESGLKDLEPFNPNKHLTEPVSENQCCGNPFNCEYTDCNERWLNCFEDPSMPDCTRDCSYGSITEDYANLGLLYAMDNYLDRMESDIEDTLDSLNRTSGKLFGIPAKSFSSIEMSGIGIMKIITRLEELEEKIEYIRSMADMIDDGI